jgi:hypothetical protein
MFAAVSFGNVRRDGNRHALCLRSETELFRFREFATQPVTLDNQFHRLLPNQQIPVAANAHSLKPDT